MKLTRLLLLFVPLLMVQFASAQTARVQIVHNSPYAEAALVDIYVNDVLTLDDVAFRDATPFLDLPAETPLTIDITGADAADNSAPVFTLADATLPTDATLLIIAAGDPLARAGNPAFDLFIGEAREAAAAGGNVEAIVFHGSPDAPTVDVVERTAGTLVDDISFGEYSPYLSVPPAAYEFDIQTADNSATAASFGADLSAAADAAVAVLASGFLAPATGDDPGFGLLAVFADGTTALLPAIDPPASPTARVQIVHNSPYAEAALVDIYVNGELTLDDVAFRDATPFLDLPAETPLTIDITGADAADNSAPVFTLADATLPTDATLLIIAAGDPLARAGNPAFDLFIGEAREAAATGGNVEAIVFHGSPDAPTVDVVERTAGTLVDDISFGEYSAYLSVPPAAYEFDIQTADNSATAASFGADLSAAADAAVAVLASGFLAPATGDDPGFGLLAVFADGTTALLPAIDPPASPMARVQIVHNSPYAEAAVVDIYIDDVLTLDDVAFRDATPFLDLPAETPFTIDITGGDAADNSAPVFTLADATLPADATLLIIAAGDPLARDGNPAFDLFIGEAREAAATSGNVEAIVFHGSPRCTYR